MKTLLFIGLLVAGFVWGDELSGFVSNHAQSINTSVKQWLVDNTPKK